ncbi:MAG: hypothetical protein M1119_01935 [Firmicutes bacterium]|nr:hypothetical protein [Bacillota bacterium]
MAPEDPVAGIYQSSGLFLSRQNHTVVGTATSPELIYPLKDASTLITDPKTFGVIMMPQKLDMED